MLDIIKSQLNPDLSKEDQINQLREFLQIIILKIIYDLGMFKYLAFTGGTALRIIYDLKRYSEDLDFSLILKKGFDFSIFEKQFIDQLLHNYKLKLTHRSQHERAVQKIDLKFEELLFELNLSTHKKEKIFIRVEADSNPPAGGETQLSLVNRSYVFTVTHYDLPSLYAGKLHACFFRTYTKGRDLYDLVWYLSKGVVPNFLLLNNAVKQTQKYDPKINAKNLKEFLVDRIKKIDFHAVRKDVERFLEDKKELSLLDKDLLLKAIESKF